jgi:hypothetical protein
MELVLNGIATYLINMATSNPKLVSALAIAYIVGLVFKIVREAVAKFVAESPSKEDDLKLAEFEKSQVAKALYFLADLLIRFKK